MAFKLLGALSAGTLVVGILAGAGAAPAYATATPAACPAGVFSAGTETVTCSYTGTLQSFTVPAGVTEIDVTVDGAQGGQTGGDCASGLGNNQGGRGGQSEGSVAVTPGEVLTVTVGGQGGYTVTRCSVANPGGAGGFGGGGAGGNSQAIYPSGGGGGGASSVAAAGTPLLIGGGGGGGAYGDFAINSQGIGGSGGGTSGGAADTSNACPDTAGPGGGATQNAGGGGGAAGGSGAAGAAGDRVTTGTGGAGADAPSGASAGGGGGGGWHGGGGGGSGVCSGGGGGGSGYTAGASAGVTGASTTAGAHSGNGVVTITYPATYVWSGAAGTGNWSDGGNWQGGSAPTPGKSTALVFPAGPCAASKNACSPVDDLGAGAVFGTLQIDNPDLPSTNSYSISGDALTLDGGVTATSDNVHGATVNDPIVLGAANTWRVTTSSVDLIAAVTGTPYPLDVELSPGANINFEGGAEVGPVTVDAASPGTQPAPTLYTEDGLNGSDGEPVTATGLYVFGTNGVYGPLSLEASPDFETAAGAPPAVVDVHGDLHVSHSLFSYQTGGQPLVATGTAYLNHSRLSLALCGPTVGDHISIISAQAIQGSLTYDGTPVTDGRVVQAGLAPGCKTPAPYLRFDVKATSLAATVVNPPPVAVYPPAAPEATTTDLSASSVTPTTGRPVTYTAAVARAGGSGVGDGSVAFTDGTAVIAGCGAIPLPTSGTGMARCTTSYPQPGTHTITAAYSGSGQYQASTSNTLTVRVSPPPDVGYRLFAADGGVFDFGGAGFHGSQAGTLLRAPVVGAAVDPATGGYWEVGADGGVFAFDAPFYGSLGAIALDAPIVGMAATPDGGGYWLVSADGAVHPFGDARMLGSLSGVALRAPIVGMVTDPRTGGYWLVAADGGVFAFDAPFAGSVAGFALDAPVVGMAASPDGGGYWLVGADGGVFSFGTAPFHGSLGADPPGRPVVGIEATGAGYLLTTADGTIVAFGDATVDGDTAGMALSAPIVFVG